MTGAKLVLAAGTSTTGIKATTGTNGVATATVHPATNTRYTWRYAGTSSRLAARSSTAVVTVEQVVTASLSHAKVRHGKPVQIFGTVSPNENGKTVVVQELVKGKWKSLPHPATIKAQNLPKGHHKVLGFVYSYHPAKKGKEKLRVRRAATSSDAAGLSGLLTLTVT